MAKSDATQLGIAQIPVRATLDELGKDLEQARNTVEKAMGNIAKRVTGDYLDLGHKVTVGLAGAGAALVAAGTAAAGVMAKLAIDALPLVQVREAFEGISGGAEEMLAALRKGSLGMISDAELMKSYNSAAQLVSKTFADQLPEAMEYLGKVAAATGQDMGFMLDSLVRGVGRVSPMILDNLGIQVDLTEAAEKWAKAQGTAMGTAIDNSKAITKERDALEKLNQQLQVAQMRQAEFTDKTSAATRQANAFTISNLTQDITEHNAALRELVASNGRVVVSTDDLIESMTKAQQQDAVFALTMEKLKENTAKMPEVAGSAAQKWEALKTQMANIKDDVGVALIPVLERIITPLGTLAEDKLPKAVEWFEKAVGVLDRVVYLFMGIPDLVKAANGDFDALTLLLEGRLTKIAEVLGLPTEQVQPLLDGIGDIARSINDFVTEDLKPFVDEHGPALKAAFEAIATFLATAAIAATIVTIGGAILGLFTPINLIITTIGLLAVAWTENWGGIQEKTKTAWDEIKRVLDGIYEGYQRVIDKIKEFLGVSNAGATTNGRTSLYGGTPSGWGDYTGPGGRTSLYGGGYATGGDFVVTRPTMILTGEAYQPERVTVTPLNAQAQSEEGAGFNFHYHDYSGMQYNRAESMAREWEYRYQMGLHSR